MRALILCMCCVAMSCRPETGPPPRQAQWLQGAVRLVSMGELREEVLPREPPACGFPLRIEAALPDPTTVSDRQGEWIELRHQEVELLDLSGWRLESSGRTRPLEYKLLPPGELFRVGGSLGSLRPVQLRNSGGTIRLVDPCGLEISRLDWGPVVGTKLAPGERLTRDRSWVQNARTPPDESQAGSGLVAADGFEPST
jgi:hypothetical protein